MAIRPVPSAWRLFALRFLHLNVGLGLFGFSIALQLRAGIGLGPWDVFHQGVSFHTPLTVGQAMVGAGLALLVFSVAFAKVRPGVGTVLNMLVIGLWVDRFLALPAFPTAQGPWDGAALFAVGLVLNGLATGLYLTAGLGAGPRDGFAIALGTLLEVPVRRARTLVEITVCAIGWLLGGTVGIGTIAFALAIGPLMQTSLRLFAGLAAWHARAAATSRRRAPEVTSPETPPAA